MAANANNLRFLRLLENMCEAPDVYAAEELALLCDRLPGDVSFLMGKMFRRLVEELSESDLLHTDADLEDAEDKAARSARVEERGAMLRLARKQLGEERGWDLERVGEFIDDLEQARKDENPDNT